MCNRYQYLIIGISMKGYRSYNEIVGIVVILIGIDMPHQVPV